MKINVTVKGDQQEFLNNASNDYSLGGADQAIRSLVKYSLTQEENDQIFSEIRCAG